MTQYAVVIRPDYTLNVRIMGPYRSRAVAEAVHRRFAVIDNGERETALAPEVLVLEAWPDVMADVEIDGQER